MLKLKLRAGLDDFVRLVAVVGAEVDACGGDAHDVQWVDYRQQHGLVEEIHTTAVTESAYQTGIDEKHNLTSF